MTPSPGGRPRLYATAAERQAAYRARKRAQEEAARARERAILSAAEQLVAAIRERVAEEPHVAPVWRELAEIDTPALLAELGEGWETFLTIRPAVIHATQRSRSRKLFLWVDGSCSGVGQNAVLGAGIVARRGEERWEWAVPLDYVGSSQDAEMLAVREALERIENRATQNVEIFTDCLATWGALMGGSAINPLSRRRLAFQTRALMDQCRRCVITNLPRGSRPTQHHRAHALAARAVAEMRGRRG